MREAEPQTWHYGLVARWWAEFNLDGPEIDYFRRFVEAGQPALDAACGTGRLLVPYLSAGLDVDGCDISPDMLALARERAEREGLQPPTLYAQALHELDLPRRYRTIVVCGAFGLGGHREHDVEGLRRLYEHLEPGGVLVLDNEVPYSDSHLWPYWLEEERQKLPRPWRPQGDRRVGSDGTEYELRSRVVELEPLSQCVTLEMKAAIWSGGERVTEEEHVLKMTLYFTSELLLMLEHAGFSDIELRAGYGDEAPTSDDDFVVFIARKP
ncbi:MAG TPA: class I SAM-dependent methyltransferase [Gaiellaceae bacterium]